jgi:hypothetical protein
MAMPTATKLSPLDVARKALAHPISFEDFLAKLSAKDKTNVERHVVAIGENPQHANLWKHLACALMTLSPHAIKVNGQQSVQFYIPDGKYRMQVYALEDLRDGKVTIYTGNTLDEAIKTGLLHKKSAATSAGAPENGYKVHGTDDLLAIDALDGATPNPAAFYKDMLGWNRKAVRITLPTNATNVQIEAAEMICALSAKKWQTAPTAA